MSMFSMPEEMKFDEKSFEKMRSELATMLPKEMSSAVNMMVHPMAGAAAMSALGTGLAFHAFGMWMGTLQGATEAAQRLYSPIYDEQPGDAASFAGKTRTPATKAKSATKKMMDDARSAADEIVGGAEVVELKPAAEVETIVAPVADKAPAELMPEDFHQPKAMEKPASPDDLKAISGIGPKLETVLNGLGVWTYDQIAGWSAEEIAWVDDYLSFKGRIGRDDWLGQAKAFLSSIKR
jgi:NADH-quinone oxidoreductase subunit E